MAALPDELQLGWQRYRSAIVAVALLSAVLNVLLLGGSIYLLMIYDSVLPSHSIATLVALFLMVTVVYLFQGLFEHMRQRILSILGTELDRKLGARVQQAMSEMVLRSGRITGDGLTPMRDLEQVRSFLTGTGPATLMDLPWIVFFLLVLSVLHYWLGLVALVGALIMVGLTYVTHRIGKKPSHELALLTAMRSGVAENNLRHVETLTALGMRNVTLAKWRIANQRYLDAQERLGRTASQLGMTSRVFRLFLQSAILTVGALLVIDGKASGGVIFAASLLSGRALAPVDQAIANWRGMTAAREGWKRLRELLDAIPEQASPDVSLPLPARELMVQGLAVIPPGGTTPTLSGVSFTLQAGQAVGVIGPSGAGKSTLARAILGLWPARAGVVRLDGASITQWTPEALGPALGYLPQSVGLLEGTIAQNIARFSEGHSSEQVIEAAQEAGAHEMIVGLPQGYDTQVGRDGGGLSAGQQQRIGLARALFGKPFLVVLDEPNSNLDQQGEAALNTAIASARARGAAIVVVAHRPALLSQTSHILFIRGGRMEAFGPRDDILPRVLPAASRGETGPQSDGLKALG